jgi:uncharacterized RDD family membrane protein YckC
MFCAKCGANVPTDSAFCGACGQPITTVHGAGTVSGHLGAPEMYAANTATLAPVASHAYAGFWLRLIAFVIDTLILLAATGVIFGIFRLFFGVSALGMVRPDLRGPATMRVFGVFELIAGVGAWLYFALMESSGWQATLGEKLMGIYVTDLQGNRIGFGRATGRYFAKIVSNFTLFIGYIMAGFTGKKQALHDMIAGCLVCRIS